MYCLRNLFGRTLACWKPWKDRIWAFLFHHENTSKTDCLYKIDTQTQTHVCICTQNKTRTNDKEIFSFFSVPHMDQFLLNQETVITLITGYFSSKVDFWWFLFYYLDVMGRLPVISGSAWQRVRKTPRTLCCCCCCQSIDSNIINPNSSTLLANVLQREGLARY